MLRAIAGLARPRRGRIALGDDVWLDSGRKVFRKPDERRVGLVFQEYALFPHLTVRQNVAYGGQGARRRVSRALPHLAPRATRGRRALSGGERQRVALARALARRPGAILLDEPLVRARRAHARRRCAPSSRSCCASSRCRRILVTHDFEDAAALADHVGVLVDGELRQLATPSELVDRPTDAFVASFTGANLLRGNAPALDDEHDASSSSRRARSSTRPSAREGERRRRRLPVGGLGRARRTRRIRR